MFEMLKKPNNFMYDLTMNEYFKPKLIHDKNQLPLLNTILYTKCLGLLSAFYSSCTVAQSFSTFFHIADP